MNSIHKAVGLFFVFILTGALVAVGMSISENAQFVDTVWRINPWAGVHIKEISTFVTVTTFLVGCYLAIQSDARVDSVAEKFGRGIVKTVTVFGITAAITFWLFVGFMVLKNLVI